MAAVNADRNLLFGLLALQNSLIDQDQLVAAFQAWSRDKGRQLAEYLVDRGDLDADQRGVVQAMVGLHERKHGGSAEKSLASIPTGRSTRERLAALGDSEIDGTLAHVGSGPATDQPDADPDCTANYSVGSATSDGQRFRVLRPHARGGLGAVFVALDIELNREVALKQILDHHADDPTSRIRFVMEAEITGGLEHPGIVPVYGLGSYGDGRPYYAMRFVRGHSLKDEIAAFHADATLKDDPGRRSLALRKLLLRFVDVCNAIDYAHTRGVLHRDIKPANVIVGKHGETLVVDWGLAKAMGKAEAGIASDERMLMPSSSSGSAETLPGSAMGTPSYMSPEQACGDLDRLGSRSDVYSLGATLCCLLTGKPPFEGDDLGAILRAVQKGDFPRPRAVDPSIDRALEAICLKAMALHPGDRYGSARVPADEVERWMADELVSAWREPFSRRARRWARQNRTAVAAAAVALLAVVLGLFALAAVQSKANGDLQKANDATTKAKNVVVAALAETRDAKNATDVALGQSEESRKQAEAVSTFLIEAFRSPDPSQDGREIKVADLLDRAVETLDKKFTGTVATKGALLNALGETDYGLGYYDKAAATFAKAGAVQESALGRDHPETLASRNNLGLATLSAGRTSEAVTILEETLKLSEPKLGSDHPDTLSRRSNLAMAYLAAGRATEAIRMDEGTLALREQRLGPDHPETLGSRNNLADDYIAAGRTEDGVWLHEGTLKLLESKLGPDYRLTIRSRNNLAEAFRAAGRPARTIELHEANLSLMEPKLGPEHPDTLQVRNNLAYSHESLGRWPVAEALRRETLARRRKTTKPESVLVAGDLTWLGRNLLNQAKRPEAEAFLRESLAIQVKSSPDGWPRFNTMSLLGEVLARQARYAEAEPLGLGGYEGMKAREAKIPAQSRIRRISEAAERVVWLYDAWGKPEQAAAWKVRHGLADLPADVFARP